VPDKLFISDFEILAFTASGDGTSNKHVPYDAHHINLMASSYSDNSEPIHRNRLLGLVSSPDQSAEGQAADLVEKIDDSLKMYNKSPLAKRSKHYMHLVKTLSMLRGVNTDHCTKEKKFAGIMKNKMIDANRELLSEEEVLLRPWDELEALFDEAWNAMIAEAGGQDAWDALSKSDQTLRHASMTKRTLISLGDDKYAELSDKEKHDLDFFVWVGCGCHKCTNSVSGGNLAMMTWWEENDVPGPILLANRDNSAVLRNVGATDDITPAEQHALETTTHGGVKAASIAGAIFNHKDDKKGQQDTFKWWFKQAGISLMFPDTSNNRYGTFCDAAAVLLQHRPKILEFLEFVRDSKNKPGFTNMEKNLYNALQDPPTLTELAVLALYGQAVYHPYVSQI